MLSDDRSAQSTDPSLARLATQLMDAFPGMAYRCHNSPSWPMEFVSAGAQRLTGHAPSAYLRAEIDYGEVIHADDRDHVWATVQRGIEARAAFEIAYRITHRTGDLRHVWEQGRPVFSPDGELLALEGFIIDDTDRHRAAEAVARAEAHRAVIAAQEQVIAELSLPVLEIAEGVLVLPVVGSISEARAAQISERLGDAIQSQKARTVILDVTGLTDFGPDAASWLVRSSLVARLLGARVALSGVRPELATALAALELPLRGVVLCGSLRHAIAHVGSR